MPKRPTSKRKANKGKPSRSRWDGPEENRVVEFFTIGWMLAVFTTLVCELSAVGVSWYLKTNPQSTGMALLLMILELAALVVGLLSLVLMAVVWNLRATRPPSGISVFALVVGAAPGLLLILRQMLR